MTDSAAPETPDDQPEKGQELERRALTPTEQWLSRQTGVEVVEAENGRMISLSRELAARVIPLCPVSQVVQLDRNWTPVPRVSWLTPRVDTYKQGNVKVGEENGRAIYADVHAPNAAALAKVATLMGIETVPGGVQWSRPVDTDHGIKCTVTARMRGADGQWKYVTRSKTVRFDDEDEAMELDLREKWEDDKAIWESAKRKKDADPSTRLSGAEYNVWRKYGPKGLTDTYVRRQVLQSREHIDASTETKAFNRCVRALSGIRSYSEAELRQKPLFTIGYFLTPDYSDPNVLGFLELVGRQSSGDLYGDGAVEDMPALPTVTDPPPPLPEGSVLDGEAGTWLDDDPGEDGEDDEPPRSFAGDGDVIDADEQGHVITDPPPGGASDDEADDWDTEPSDMSGADDAEPEDAIVAPDDDWTFPTPENGTSPVAGRSMSDLAASPAGLALLRRATAKMRNAERKRLAEAWIAYGEANPS